MIRRLLCAKTYKRLLNNTTPTIVKTEVASGTIQWQADLADVPLAMTLDAGSQNFKEVQGQLAVALDNHNVTVMSLDDGSVLNTFASRYGKSTIRTSSIAFRDGGSLLWTVGTRYTGDAEHRTYISISAWDVARGQRIATAEVPGQVMSTGWNPYGTQLATVRYFNTVPSGQKHVPWAFHLWDVKIVRAESTLVSSPPKTE